MNAQPHYHTIGVLLTATAKLNGDVIREILEAELPKVFPGIIVKGTIDVEYCEAEAGSPDDLMDAEVYQ